MEALQQLGSALFSFGRGIERSITKVFGSSNDRRVRKIGFNREKDGSTRITAGSTLDRINQLEPEFEKLTDDELRQCTAKFRARLWKGETLDQLLPEAFAAVRESGRRNLRMRHFDVQMVGGYVLHNGMIAEMTTGEGKTLVATLPAYLNGLAGKVHVVTVNDYLARRDMEWMGPIHMALGMTVGAIQSHMDPDERKKAYSCDITYGTNNEFGFDYLRDNMKPTREAQVQGRLDFALVDEIDNILIDEARTPLIISGLANDDPANYEAANVVARQLVPGEHFEIKEKEHTCHLTETGIRQAERLAGVESFYTYGNMHWPHLIDNSLKAHHLYKRDVHYVVERGDVIIIDEHTGRKMIGRQWSDGLHQAVEAKEGVKIKEETQTLATITLQNYFKLYKKLAGMTGTAMTEADEFLKIYNLDVINIPTNRPSKRINSPDTILRSEREKWNAVVEEIKTVGSTGRPVLVGTVSIEKSEILSEHLKRAGIKHNLLNAKFHEREAEIIAQAGRLNAVTISTNMAGRGTDIILGGNPEFMAWAELSKTHASRLDVTKAQWDEVTSRISREQGMADEGRKVAELGGLHVVGTERHDSRRIDLQLRGRAGRQGDPGSSRFFISLDDDLMRIFMGDWVRGLLTQLGMQEGEAIESRMVTNRIEGAQKKREEAHFDMRKHLLEYDEVMDVQRKEIYSLRQRSLEGASCKSIIVGYVNDQCQRLAERFLSHLFRWDNLAHWARETHNIAFDAQQIHGMADEQIDDFLRHEYRRQADNGIADEIEVALPEHTPEDEWNWQSLTNWANRTFQLELKVEELKAVPRAEIHTFLYKFASERADQLDLTAVPAFVSAEFPIRALIDAVQRQFGIAMDPAEFLSAEVDFVTPVLRERVMKFYRDKEIQFPVRVGVSRFLAQEGDTIRVDAEGLVAFANSRFGADLKLDELVGMSYEQLMTRIMDASAAYIVRGDAIDGLDDRLDAIYGPRKADRDSSKDTVQSTVEIPSLIAWANEHFAADLEADDFDGTTRLGAQALIQKAHARRFRPELHQIERVLLLDFVDGEWKDHLHSMDSLRRSVNLQSYAQKDPKAEYAQQGMEKFRQMKRIIGERLTGNVFRIEQNITPEYVTSLWRITEETHPGVVEDIPPTPPMDAPSADRTVESSGSEPPPAVAPIRNRSQRIGRNDPCPCGSGKKYKKCCGEHL